MNEHSAFTAFLRTDPRDVGCDQALTVLHLYVDLIPGRLLGHEAILRYPA
ncbi:hypothetical protein M6D93_12205 [Jatrophihabitans telluris]|uniref:Uncharacterized protein n=1 Tax=Jatrophihabitans telluris TaxID=2038343 RepID=A0ABY4QUG3_9ACTN|nr:hypothetical protein [Jatrophihabitans telluris]UQX87068.1 hypothetical protein M6D93_12205 [Jatrophihabitans telluris]